MATRQEFSDFLKSTELRAFKQAMFAVRDESMALDIVQEAMMKLTGKYADKPVEELPPLFQRILQNAIYDHYRRQKSQSSLTTLFSAFLPPLSQGEHDHYDADFDPLETMHVAEGGKYGENPQTALEQIELIAAIEKALEDLPLRQREAFLLRYWEEMDVSETARIMGCSEGSVKTHCSRAAHALAAMLRSKGVML